MKTSDMSGGVVAAVLGFILLCFVSQCNNINFLVDSWDKEGLQIREVIAIVGVPVAPIGVINGGVYLFEDEVSY